jgi:hypothetical protein
MREFAKRVTGCAQEKMILPTRELSPRRTQWEIFPGHFQWSSGHLAGRKEKGTLASEDALPS